MSCSKFLPPDLTAVLDEVTDDVGGKDTITSLVGKQIRLIINHYLEMNNSPSPSRV